MNKLRQTSKWLLAIAVTLGGFGAYAQTPISCSHQSHTQKFREQLSPDQLHQLQQKSTLSAKPAVADTGQTLIVPIVFHVVHGGGQENISDAQIIESVVQINEDFRATNAGQADIVTAFQSISADVGMEFRLAELDPNGNPTTGITRRYEPLWTTDGSYYANDIKSATQWDPTKYLNVWVVSSSDGGNGSAYAFYPADADASPVLDGVISSHWAIGRTGTAASTHYKILTHEIGHWANLKHTWGDQSNNGDTNGCNYDDGVADTPNTYGTTGCDLTFEACGGLTNVQNFMDYANCSVMFTEGQKTRMRASMFSSVAGRDNLWSAANLDATLINGRTIPRILYTSTVFSEHYNNDGSIADPVTIELFDVAFSKTGVFSSGVDFTATNVPAGLTLSVNATSTTEATITLTGNASSHLTANNISNIGISFADGVFSGYTASQVLNANNTSIQTLFIDPYEIVYNNIDDIVVGSSNPWKWFSLDVGNASFGAWYFTDNATFKLETYDKAAISNTGTKEIAPLMLGDVIETPLNMVGKSWELPGTYPNQLDITTATHTPWIGTTAYAGITFELSGRTHHGWIRIAVNAAGTEMTILDWAYNEEPFAPITAGGVEDPMLVYSSTSFSEASVNDGSFTQNITADVLGTTLSKTGILTQGVDYTVSGTLPAGLSIVANAVSTTQVDLQIQGNATNHLKVDDASFTISFANSVFTAAPAIVNQDLAISFRDAYRIVYNDVSPDLSVNTTDVWAPFSIADVAYGIFYNADASSFQLETYQQDAVVESGTLNLSLIGESQVISAASNFVAGGAYPNLHNVTNASYTTWNGQTGYVGLRFMKNGEMHYAWVKLSVAADGTSYSLLSWAYNEEPNAPITTGVTDPQMMLSKIAFVETTANDGAIHPISVSLDGTTFTTTGVLTEGVHYIVRGTAVPAGLSVAVNATSTTTAELQLTGTATSHEAANSLDGLIIEFKDAAFVSGDASKVANSYGAFRVYYTDAPYTIIYEDPANASITSTDTWYFFRIDGLSTAEYGLYYNADSASFQLETYTKDAVISSDLNLLNHAENDAISTASNFVAGGAWPNLHNITNASYTTWNGTTAYVGISFMIDGLPHYGWIQLEVAPDGATVTLIDHAYSTEPYGTILAGEKPDVIVTPSNYCDASNLITNFSVNMSNVAFADLNNSSPTWTAWGDTSYRDFTAQKASVVKGDTHTLTLTISDANLSDKTNLKSYVWIDWNANGTFEVSEETEVTFSGDYSMATASITVPTDAVEGDTRMRIRITDYDTYNGLPAADRPCAYGYNGETEDYTVTISSTLSTADNAFASALVLYPVPMNDVLHVVTPSEDSSSVSVVVYTLSGQVISTSSKKAAANHVAVGVSNLAPGAYVVKVSQSGKTATRLVIKN